MSDEKENQEAQKEVNPSPVDMKRILDGDAFIREINTEPDPELHPWETCRGTVLIREVGHEVGNLVLVAQFRQNADGMKEFDSLATADRAFCMAIQQCVVNDKRVPLWKPENVKYMFDGPKAPSFRQFLQDCYEGVCSVNPHIHPAGNPTALRRLLRWF